LFVSWIFFKPIGTIQQYSKKYKVVVCEKKTRFVFVVVRLLFISWKRFIRKITVPRRKVRVYLIPEACCSYIADDDSKNVTIFYFLKRIIQISFHKNFKNDGVGFYMDPTIFSTHNLEYLVYGSCTVWDAWCNAVIASCVPNLYRMRIFFKRWLPRKSINVFENI